MSEQQQARFDGWAIVDVLGHQRYVGYVTTEAYGAAVLFRVDVPALEERERTTKQPGYANGVYLPAGSVVKEGAVPGYTKLVGSGSIYTITPCTKEAALEAVENMQHRPLMVVSIAHAPGLPPPADESNDLDDDDDEGDADEDLDDESDDDSDDEDDDLEPAAEVEEAK